MSPAPTVKSTIPGNGNPSSTVDASPLLSATQKGAQPNVPKTI